MVSVSEVIKEIMSINEKTAPKWISQGLSSLTPEMLEQAINEWQDPLMLVDFLNLENTVVKGAAKMFILKPYWETVDKTLKDPWELYNQISKNPEKKKLLDAPRGREWLNYVRKRVFEYFYYYTWGRKCPKCNSEMFRKKTLDYPKVISNISMESIRPIQHDDYICKSCRYIIPSVSTSAPKRETPQPIKTLYPQKLG